MTINNKKLPAYIKWGGPQMGPLRLKAHIFCLHLQNISTNFYDFWHTSLPFYSKHIGWFKVHQIY